MRAASLELLRREESVSEIDEEPDGHDAGQPIVECHSSLLEVIADDGVADREYEEAEPEGKHDHVQHGFAPCGLLPWIRKLVAAQS